MKPTAQYLVKACSLGKELLSHAFVLMSPISPQQNNISKALIQILGQMMPRSNIVLLPWDGWMSPCHEGKAVGPMGWHPQVVALPFPLHQGDATQQLAVSVFPSSQPPCPPASIPISSSQAPFQCTHFIFFPLGCLVSHSGEKGSWRTWFALLTSVVLPDFRGHLFCQWTAGLGQSSPCRYISYC